MIRKLLIAIAIVLVVLLGGYTYTKETTIEYVKEPEKEVVAEPVEVEIDAITKVQQELDRISKELDVQEQDLLKQAEHINTELERIRKTRASFQ